MRFKSLMLAAFGAAFSMSAAQAQMLCGERAELVKALAEGHNEILVGEGLTSRGVVMEIFVSESGSWTILGTNPQGLTCFVNSGENWETVKPVKPSQES